MYDPKMQTMITVADCGSFSRAAERLFLSVNSVRKQIALLEQQTGVVIFRRSPRGVALTDAGKVLYFSAHHIIQMSTEALARAKSIEHDAKARIRFGASVMFPVLPVMPLLRRACCLLPGLSIEIVPFQDRNDGLSRSLRHLGEEIDMIFCTFPKNGLPGICGTLGLDREGLYYLMSTKHRLAGKKNLSELDVEGERILIPRICGHDFIPQGCDALEKHHRGIIEYTDHMDEDTLNLCEQGDILFVAAKRWEELHPMLKALPPARFNSSNTVPRGLCYSLHPSPAVQELLHAVALLKDAPLQDGKTQKNTARRE